MDSPLEPLDSLTVRMLNADDIATAREMIAVFGDAFEDPDTYGSARPSSAYLEKLLGSECFVAIAALVGDTVVGGIAAYELKKLEQERSELYIYDLAVAEEYRRRGVASALIEETRRIAAARGAWVVYVQADPGDDPAIALYTKHGVREDVLHFDIPPSPDVGLE